MYLPVCLAITLYELLAAVAGGSLPIEDDPRPLYAGPLEVPISTREAGLVPVTWYTVDSGADTFTEIRGPEMVRPSLGATGKARKDSDKPAIDSTPGSRVPPKESSPIQEGPARRAAKLMLAEAVDPTPWSRKRGDEPMTRHTRRQTVVQHSRRQAVAQQTRRKTVGNARRLSTAKSNLASHRDDKASRSGEKSVRFEDKEVPELRVAKTKAAHLSSVELDFLRNVRRDQRLRRTNAGVTWIHQVRRLWPRRNKRGNNKRWHGRATSSVARLRVTRTTARAKAVKVGAKRVKLQKDRLAYPPQGWPKDRFFTHRCRRTPGVCLAEAAEYVVDDVLGPWRRGRTNYMHVPNGFLSISHLWQKDTNYGVTFRTDCSGFVSWVLKHGIGEWGRLAFEGMTELAYRRDSDQFKGKARNRFIKKIDKPQAAAYYIAFTEGQKNSRWKQITRVDDIRRGDIMTFRITREQRTDTGHIFIILNITEFLVDGRNFAKPGFKMYEARIADATSRYHYGNDTRKAGGCSGKHVGRANSAECGESDFIKGSCHSGCGVGMGNIYIYQKLGVKKSASDLYSVALHETFYEERSGLPRRLEAANSREHEYAVARLCSEAYVTGKRRGKGYTKVPC